VAAPQTNGDQEFCPQQDALEGATNLARQASAPNPPAGRESQLAGHDANFSKPANPRTNNQGKPETVRSLRCWGSHEPGPEASAAGIHRGGRPTPQSRPYQGQQR